MTEKPIKEFETITTQEEFDERIKARLARERERWQKESGTEELQQQLRAKDEEISQIRHEHFLEDARRIERALKFIDFSEASDTSFALNQVDSLARDFPELVPPRGAGSGGSSRPVLQPQQKPLTREEVEGMSESEINSRWDQVKAFMQGQRS
jgi:hypothetical protein